MALATTPEYASCRPNISPGAMKRRRIASLVMGLVSVGLLVASVAFHWPWYGRVWVGLAVGVTVMTYLQVVRHTCIARAADGTFENDDGSRTPMVDAEVAASRRVAASIRRDGALAGVCAAVLAGVSALFV